MAGNLPSKKQVSETKKLLVETSSDSMLETEVEVDNLRDPPVQDSINSSERPVEPGVGGAIFNLTNFAIGAGVLGIPWAFKEAGVVLGIFILILLAFAVYLSMLLLLWSSEHCKGSSYEDLGLASGGRWCALITRTCIFIASIGPLAAYMNLVGESIANIVTTRSPDAPAVWSNTTWLAFLQTVVVVLPLCFLKDISKLGFTSLLSLIPLIYLCFLQIVYVSIEPLTSAKLETWATGTGFFSALPVCAFAYSCQIVLPPIAREMGSKGGNFGVVHKVIKYSVGISVISYLFVGILGYVQYGPATEEIVMLNFPTNPATDLLLVSMAISILLSMPVVLWPCRETFDGLFFAHKPYSYVRFVVENIGLLILSFAIAAAIPSFIAILGIFGSFSQTAIGFILPPFFYLRLAPKHIREDPKKWLSLVLMIAGGIIGFISCIVTIINYANSH